MKEYLELTVAILELGVLAGIYWESYKTSEDVEEIKESNN